MFVRISKFDIKNYIISGFIGKWINRGIFMFTWLEFRTILFYKS